MGNDAKWENKKRNAVGFGLGDVSVLGRLRRTRDGKSWSVLGSEEEDLFYPSGEGSCKLAIPGTVVLLLPAPCSRTTLTLRSRWHSASLPALCPSSSPPAFSLLCRGRRSGEAGSEQQSWHAGHQPGLCIYPPRAVSLTHPCTLLLEGRTAGRVTRGVLGRNLPLY